MTFGLGNCGVGVVGELGGVDGEGIVDWLCGMVIEGGAGTVRDVGVVTGVSDATGACCGGDVVTDPFGTQPESRAIIRISATIVWRFIIVLAYLSGILTGGN